MRVDYETRLWMRRVAGVVLPVLLVAAAIAYHGQAPSSAALRASDRHPPVSGPTTAVVTPSSTSPTTTSGPTEATAPVTPSPTTDVAQSGPGLDRPGTRLAATITSDGSLEVSEQVRLRTPVRRLVLRPPVPPPAEEALSFLEPRATSLQLTAGGQPVTLRSASVAAGVVVDLPVATDAVELRYVLVDTTVRSIPSTTGRALALLGPLVVVEEADHPVLVATSGPGVLNISCTGTDGISLPCAVGDPGALRIREPLTPATALVLLQVDLPRP